jgi:hypothetical protein
MGISINVIVRTLVLLCLTALVIAGCAVTNLESFADPDVPNRSYRHVLIYAGSENLEFRKAMETSISERLAVKGIKSTRCIDMFPPTREFTPDEVVTKADSSGVDAYIFVEFGAQGTDIENQPIWGSTTRTHGTGTSTGSTFSYQGTSQTSYQGGGTYKRKWAEFRARFYDAKSGRMIWLASANSKGAGFWESDRTLIDSFSTEMIMKLYRDNVLKP